jgi:hypothetical protein
LGNGTFSTPISTGLPDLALFGLAEGNLQLVAVADFNNDGIPDLVIGAGDSNFDKALGQ